MKLAAEKKAVSFTDSRLENAKSRQECKEQARIVLFGKALCTEMQASRSPRLSADRLSKSETRAVQPLRSKSAERMTDCGCAVYWT